MPRLGTRSTWSRVGDLTMHARVPERSGAPGAPAIVLVHGFVVSSIYMVPTALRLAPRWRAFAPDLPGFGASDHPPLPLTVPGLADALAAWMDSQQLAGATLLGNSLGCQVVVDLAVRFPGLAEGLVLVGPTVDPSARTVGAQVRRMLVDTTRERPSLALLHARDWLRAGPAEILSTIKLTIDDRIERKLPRVLASTLVVVGDRDPLVPRDWAEEATSLLPNGRLVVVAGGPHALNYSAPDALVAAIEHAFPSSRGSG